MTKTDSEREQLQAQMAEVLNRFDPHSYGTHGAPIRALWELVEQHYAFKCYEHEKEIRAELPKPLTEAEQDLLEYTRQRRQRGSMAITPEEYDLLLALADRLPREPRKKTLGQVLQESLMASPPWGYASESKALETYERSAQAVIDEYVLRTRGEP